MEDKVSIIVPIYNTSKYLKQCITSITNQTYKNIEIILINDGSTDDSNKICDNFKKNDIRIKVLHQKNKGLSYTRNKGIELSTGQYITFIDSDDYVESTYIEKLVKKIKESDADIVQCDFKYVGECNTLKRKRNIVSFSKFTGHKKIKQLLLNDIVETMAWGKIYKKELFDNIKYPEKKYYEDLYTTYKLIDKAKNIVVINEQLYMYRITDNSITNKIFNIKQLDLIHASIERKNFIENNYKELTKYARGSICHNACKCLEKIFNSDKELKDLKEELSFIKKNIKSNVIPFIIYYKCSLKTKIFAFIASINIRLCLKLYKIVKK